MDALTDINMVVEKEENEEADKGQEMKEVSVEFGIFANSSIHRCSEGRGLRREMKRDKGISTNFHLSLPIQLHFED